MVERQTKNAINILNLLLADVKHLKSKWTVYQDQGYLFETSSFDLSIEYIKKLIGKITETNETIASVFSDECPVNNILPLTEVIESIHSDTTGRIFSIDETNMGYDDIKHEKQRRILLTNTFNDKKDLDAFYKELMSLDHISLNMHKISNIIKNTYLEIEAISDLINALDFNFSKRLVGIDTTEIGTELDTRSFGNIQIIYNVAETLMFDYVSSINDVEKYDGQVVFGFRNRAISHPPFKVVVCPSYAEFYLEYLSILAHEAFHIVEISKKPECVQDEIISMKENLEDILKPLAPHWSDQDIGCNIESMTLNKMASDVLADIYAICVGGDAYYSTMKKFYIPLLYDLVVQERAGYPNTDYLHSKFSISSLRSRVCNSAHIFAYGDNEVNSGYNEYIEQWETLSINLNRHSILKTDIHNEQKKSALLDELDFIGCATKKFGAELIKSKILPKMSNLISEKHTGKDNLDFINNNLYNIQEKGTVANLLSGTPSVNQLNEMWLSNKKWLRPRHILSMYTENENMNRNALLFMLGNHEFIKGRY